MIKRFVRQFKNSPAFLRFLLNVYPPYLGAGVKTMYISPDFREVVVEMPLKWFNRNYVGTHFGGSIYSMTDPFYMIMLIKNLGPDYVVWDQEATVRFIRPGRGTLKAVFRLTDEDIKKIIKKTESGRPYRPEFKVEVMDEKGEVVAEVRKVLYVKRKGDR